MFFLVSDRLGGQVSDQKDAGTLDKVKILIKHFLAKLQILHFVLWLTICHIYKSTKCMHVLSSNNFKCHLWPMSLQDSISRHFVSNSF